MGDESLKMPPKFFQIFARLCFQNSSTIFFLKILHDFFSKFFHDCALVSIFVPHNIIPQLFSCICICLLPHSAPLRPRPLVYSQGRWVEKNFDGGPSDNHIMNLIWSSPVSQLDDAGYSFPRTKHRDSPRCTPAGVGEGQLSAAQKAGFDEQPDSLLRHQKKSGGLPLSSV